MAIFYRGAGIGSYWHTNDARQAGFSARRPEMHHSADRILIHIAQTTTTTPYISLTRSYSVANRYARSTIPTTGSPAYIYEIQLCNPRPNGVNLLDPVKEVAKSLPDDVLDGFQYQHDGLESALLALIVPDKRFMGYTKRPCLRPPNSNPPDLPTTITPYLKTLISALRDAEILAIGHIPKECVTARYEVTR